ncbi:hypothetical protein NQ314_003251, partial [Rhamnusium bicolor]
KAIVEIAKCRFPIKKEELLSTVQKIMKDKRIKTHFKDDTPGQKWYLGFLRRHPEIRARTAETINKARATVTEEHNRNWFREFKSYLLEIHAVDLLEDPSRILNGDEI